MTKQQRRILTTFTSDERTDLLSRLNTYSRQPNTTWISIPSNILAYVNQLSLNHQLNWKDTISFRNFCKDYTLAAGHFHLILTSYQQIK